MDIISTFSELDSMFFNYKKLMYEPELTNKLRNNLLEKVFNFHLENNHAYTQYVSRSNFLEIKNIKFSSENIPLLPSSFFKGYKLDILSLPKSKILKYCTSSGTQGSISIVPRDEITLMYFLSSISASFPALLNIDRTGNHKGIILGPSTEEAGDIWFSYAIACLTLHMTTEVCERNHFFDLDYAVNNICKAISNKNDVFIVGPPFRILEICEVIKKNPHWPLLTEKSYIISAGGWKNRQNEAIDKSEFIHTVADSFRLKNTGQIRDCFNMVELNSIILECEHHQKHIPPWLEVQARDPKTNVILPNGEIGILAFLDTTAMSYPCFILSEDFGSVLDTTCSCGRSGQLVEIKRRMGRIEARGCALKMAVGISGKIYDSQKDRFFESFYRNPSAYIE